MVQDVFGVFLCAAVYWDWKRERIPNLLCLFGSIIGLALHVFIGGRAGSIGIAYGVFWTLAIMIPLWMWGVIGAGDAKLGIMAAVYLKKKVIPFFFLSALCLAVYGVYLMIERHNFWERMELFMEYIKECVEDGAFHRYPFCKEKEEDRESAGIRMSYGVLAGYLIGRMTGMF